MSTGISVFLITRNEEARLGATLAALEGFEDIVVVDSGSTDRTIEIAEAAGARVFHRDWTGYGPQKVYAEGQCRNDWVLNIDADEVVPPALATELHEIVSSGRPPGAWRVRILTVYPGASAPRPFANDYNVVRFYHRSVAGYRDHPLFDRVVPKGGQNTGTVKKGSVQQLAAPIHHHSMISFSHFVEKENVYSDYVARTAPARSTPGLLIRLPFEMPISFLKFYLFRRHITGGWRGFVFAMVASFSRMMRIAKMLERR